MRPIHLLAAVLALGLLLGGLWSWIGTAGVVRAAGTQADDASGDGARARDLARATEADARDETGAGAGRTALFAPPSEPAPEDAARAARAKPRLGGRVVDAAGVGVPGARVWASTSTHWVQIPLDVEPEGLPTNWIKLSKTVCDAEGRFVLEDVKPGPLRVAARAAGFAPTYLDHLDLPAYEERTLADVRLERGASVAGQVVGRDGQGVPGARVLIALDCARKSSQVVLPGRGVPATETDADGKFLVDELAPGPWHLLVDAPGFLLAECDGRTERAGDRSSGVVVRLEAGLEIQGKVVSKDAPLPAGVRIAARLQPEKRGGERPESSDEEEPRSTTTNDVRARFALVADDGTFVVNGLKAGARYRLSAAQRSEDEQRGWKPLGSIEGASATAGDKGVELVHKPESVLVFRIVDDATGAPISDAVVFAGVGRERALRDDKGEVRHAFEAGRVRYPELRPPANGSKLVLLRVRAPGYKDHENKNVPLKPGAELDLGDVRLVRERVVIATIVDDATGAPVPDARVVLATQKSDEDLEGLSRSSAEVDLFGDAGIQFARAGKDGRARLTSYPGKMASAQASAKGFLASEIAHVLLPGEADHALELRLRHGGTVIAKVTDGFGHAVAGVAIQHRLPRRAGEEDDEFGEPRKSGADGLVTFDALAPGVHAFQVHEEQGDVYFWNEQGSEPEPAQWLESVVTAGSRSTLEFVAPPRGSIAGHVREGGRPVEGAHVKVVPRKEGGEQGMAYWGGQNDPFSTVTDHEGRYRLENLRCGEYTALVTHSGRRMAAEFPVAIAPDPRTYDFVLEIAGVEGRVTDPDGRPLAGLVVNAYRARGGLDVESPYHMVVLEDERGNPNINWEQVTRSNERTDSQGRYNLTGLLTDEPLLVQVEGEWVEHKSSPEITLSHDETRAGVDFVLRLAGKVEVVMQGGGGRGRNDAWYRVRVAHVGPENEQRSYETVVGSWNRSQTIGSVLPGKYKVTIRRHGDEQGAPLVDTEVEVAVGTVARVPFQP